MSYGQRNKRGWLVAGLGLVLGLTASSGRAADETPQPVRIGLVSSLFRDTSEPLMQVIMRPFRALLEAQTGMTGQLVAGGDANHLAQRLQEGDVHLGVFHGVEFAWARRQVPQLKPLLLAVNQQPFLRAHLVVRNDGKVRGLADLKGQVVALPYMSREHCWLYLQRRCVLPGTTPENFFGRVSTPRDACYAIDDVIDGSAQAAVIDDTELTAYRTRYPEYFAKVRVLQQSEAFPCAVIGYYPGKIGEELVERFRAGLLAAKASRQGRQTLQMCRITSFEDVSPDYEQMLTDIAKAYPPPRK